MPIQLTIFAGMHQHPAEEPEYDFLASSKFQHTAVLIESVGVAHVITKVTDDDPGYAFSDVTVQRNVDGKLTEHTPLIGSVSETHGALAMHAYWCDVQRLIKCIRGDFDALHMQDVDWGSLADDDGGADADDASDEVPEPSPRLRALMDRADSRYVRTPDPETLRRLEGQSRVNTA